MIKTETRGAQCSLSWAGGVLVVEAVGFLTTESATMIRMAVHAATRTRHAVKVVTDLRRAAVLVDWSALTEVGLCTPRIEPPTGILIDSSQALGAVRHANRMLAKGLTRVVFTDLADVLDWVEIPVPQLRPLASFQPATPQPQTSRPHRPEAPPQNG